MYRAVVFDIDGVLLNIDCILDEIRARGLSGAEEYEYFYEHCNDSRVKVIEGGRRFYNFIRYCDDYVYCILLTARNEKVRDKTLKRLADDGILCDRLYMRKVGDTRSDAAVKKEYLQEIMKDFDIICFVDDDADNCAMAKELGLFVLRAV